MFQNRISRLRAVLWPGLACVSIVLFLSSSAWAEKSQVPKDDSVSTEEARGQVTVVRVPAAEPSNAELQAVGAFGLWVFLDPETGEITTPTPEQSARRRAFDASLNKSDLGLTAFELQEGGRGVHLSGRFQHALKVTVAEDGSLHYSCSDHDHSSDDYERPVVEAPVQ